MRTGARLLGLIGLLGIPGCLGNDGEPVPTRDQFCRAWAEQACSKETVSRCQAADAEACRLSQQQFCLSLVPQSFSGEQSDSCLFAVRDAYLDGNLSSPELRTVLRLDFPCDRLVRGPKQAGQSCRQTSECDAVDGYQCVRKPGKSAGSCELPEVVEPGGKCDRPAQVCTDKFYCNGENCISAEELGEPCSSHEPCGPEAYCAASGNCEARFGVDSDCTEDFECRSDLCYTFAPDDRVCIDRLVLSRSEPVCTDLR